MKSLKPIARCSDGDSIRTEDYVVTEEIIEITINQNPVLKISAIPEFHLEMLYGLLITSGSIKSNGDIRAIEISGNRVKVAVSDTVECGIKIGASGSRMPDESSEPVERAEFAPLPDYDIRPVFRKFRTMSELFRETGAVHSSALLLPEGEVKYFSEDVGRHNAIDKTIGKAIVGGCDLKETFLLTSGRVSGEIARKSAWAGLKGILSPSAPTSLAIETAEKYKLTVAGFIRENRYNIYTAEI